VGPSSSHSHETQVCAGVSMNQFSNACPSMTTL